LDGRALTWKSTNIELMVRLEQHVASGPNAYGQFSTIHLQSDQIANEVSPYGVPPIVAQTVGACL